MPIKTKTSTQMLLTKSVQAAKEKNLKSIVYIELFIFISHGKKY